MSSVRHPSFLLKVTRIVVWILAGITLSVSGLSASESALELSTNSQVTPEGKVAIALTLKNSSSQPLFHIHPMFHFHHTMSHMPMVHRLDPGESVLLKNGKHPPVKSVGSYPVVAMVSYKETEQARESRTSVHTDTFYYREPKASMIEGSLKADVDIDDDSSIIRVLLRNPSSSFKNIRMMLLLPPELTADRFQGMMGFTLRGGEEKSFEVPVRNTSGLSGGVYPVHLLVEYGEMLKHFSGDIRGEINFGPEVGQGALWPQMLVFLFVFITLVLTIRRVRTHSIRSV